MPTLLWRKNSLRPKRNSKFWKKVFTKKKLSPGVKELLALKIDTLGFSSRLVNVYVNANIKIVADLVCQSRREFLNNRHCGQLSINEVDKYLNEKGLEWEMKI